MKKLLLTILFLSIFSIAAFGQNYNQSNIQKVQQVQKLWSPDPNNIPLTNITLNQVQNGWAQMGTTCAGCASYYYQILETPTPY